MEVSFKATGAEVGTCVTMCWTSSTVRVVRFAMSANLLGSPTCSKKMVFAEFVVFYAVR